MARVKLRSRREVLERVHALSQELKAALTRVRGGERNPELADTLWQTEGLGMLCWALGLVELQPFDRHFDPEWLLATPTAHATLRAKPEIEHAREAARLWHWRARTAALRDADGALPLPGGWNSLEQLVAVAAMRGYERGLLPSPLRGDFPACGAGYRELGARQLAELHSIAYERHRALEWLCGGGRSWERTRTDT